MESLYTDAEALLARQSRAEGVSEDLALRTYTARLLGQNPELVLHGGGNTSVKSTARTIYGEEVAVLHVKGSGWDLATIEPAGHPACRLDLVTKLADLPSLDDESMVNGLRLALLDSSAPTPSVETILHALLPAKFVDHTHADAVLALVDQRDSEKLVRECFPRGLVFVPYVMPGFSLAHACRKAWDDTVGRGETPEVMVLDKHGIFTFGETAKESYERMIACVTRAERYAADRAHTQSVEVPKAAAESFVLGLLPALRGALARAAGLPEECGPILSLRSTDSLLGFLGRRDLRDLVSRGSATPDHVIRTKPWPMVLGELPHDGEGLSAALDTAIAAYRASYDAYFVRMRDAKGASVKKLDSSPKVVAIPGVGIVTVGDTRSEAEATGDVYEHTAHVMTVASDIGRYEPTSAEDLFDVEYWSLEQKKLGKPAARKPLSGKVALVTGAARGIGRATALELLAEGAHVVLSDRDQEAVAATSADLARTFGASRVFAMRCDVSSEEAVAALVRATVRHFGGLDVLVSNAGGASEGMLDTPQGHEALLSSLELNTMSHARVARHVTQVMKSQGRGGSLLFNASKSAFAPGPGFGPYAVAKAALVALVRQFAIDLAPFGIRANAVNADRIRTDLFGGGMAEARAKARGLTTDQYFRANMLGREVMAKDVARAFVHLAEARATTGAVTGVDGGNAAAFPR